MRAAHFLTCGHPSTRSLRLLPQNDKIVCLWERGSPTTESNGSPPGWKGTAGCHRFIQPRPSGLPAAAQRRTIGVVARGRIEGLRPRRWNAGGLLPYRYRCTGSFRREGCPAAPLCGSRRGAGWSFRHNGVPGTPRWRPYTRVLSGVPGTPRWGAICPSAQWRARHAPVSFGSRVPGGGFGNRYGYHRHMDAELVTSLDRAQLGELG